MRFRRFGERLLSLDRLWKRLMVLSMDAGLSVLTVWLAFYLRLGEAPTITPAYGILTVVATGLCLGAFWILGLYKEIFSQAGIRTVSAVGRACLAYAAPMVAIYTLIGFEGVPRTIGLIHPILMFITVAGSRLVIRRVLGELVVAGADGAKTIPHVLIYGAGASGRHLAASVGVSRELRLIGFLDDDRKMQGHIINGAPIFNPDDLERVARRFRVTDVLLALPSVGQRRRNEMIAAMRAANLRVRTLPSMAELASGSVRLSDIRELDVQDLLGRDPVDPDPRLFAKCITGRTVLVTGAGGSIGGELCRQILAAAPTRLLLLEISEYALYAIHEELTRKAATLEETGAVEIVPLIGSVTDAQRVRAIIDAWKPETIYHAAAYKHVPLVEHNPAEGLRNNVLGTLTVATAARDAGVADFVLISTDKAVRPTNIMGASKRAAELVLQALAAQTHRTCFSMVRFGNVLGSSGSVVPLFRQQIQNGGPVTITDLRITRYFMTIPEAAQLVIQAGAMAKGGDVFVLDMGEPIQIRDLARNMIELSGHRVRDAHNPDGDIEIVEIGLRPGEKLYEELLIGDDPAPTDHPRILKANEDFLSLPRLNVLLDGLNEALVREDAAQMRSVLGQLVPEFKPQSGIVDFVHCARAVEPRIEADPRPALSLVGSPPTRSDKTPSPQSAA